MALTTTQVNQAFLGLLGRPATGAEAAKFAGQLDAATLAQTLLTDASFKSQLSVETLSFKTVDLLNTDPAAFVESLYTALLGRASDAEGKAFWLSVAGATPNRADVVSQFIAAVQAQEGTADANAFASIQAEDKALASAWVESLYNNLAGRASDAEGLDFWTNAIVSFAMTPAQVAASFAAALALQGNTTEDGQNFAAKLGVADNFTASFKDFNALITANEKAEQLKNLVTMMNGVNKDSQVDQYTEEITKITDEYQKIAAVQFTAADDDNLGIDPETGESNLKGAANFTGTYNLTNAAKGTIQSSDSATGTEAYLTDTLTINVTGYDKTTHDTFNLSELPSTSSVEKLVINNGAASVNGSVAGDFQYINVNGTGEFNIVANTNNALKDISLNSTSDKDNIFTTANDLDSIKTGAGNDTLNLGFVSKSLSTGAGKDNVVANIGKDATADLGAGDDTFSGTLEQAAKLNAGAGDDTLNVFNVGKNASINAGTGDDTIKLQYGINHTDGKGNPISTVEIDGGVGKDVIDFTDNVLDKDYTGIKSIKGVETIKVLDGIKLNASAISGQKIELDNNGNLILDAKDATSVDLSKLSLADAANVSLQINNLKSNITLKKTDANSNSHIAETITLDKDAKGIKISNFEVADDVIKISGVDVSTEKLGTATPVSVARNKIYELTTTDNKQTVTKTNIENGLLGVDLTKVADGDVFYIARSLLNASGSSNNTVVYKVYVGKAVNGTSKIAKVDTLTTINTKDIDFTKNFVKADDYAEVIAPVNGVVTIPSEGTDPISIKTDNLKNGDTLTISGANVDTKDVIVPSAKGQNINVNVDTKVKSLTLGDANETITYTDAANLPETINAGAGNDTIDLSAVVDPNGLAVEGGDGRDTLIISGNNTITSLKSVESINIKGTSINADALSENNASVSGTIALVNTKTDAGEVTLEVNASGATSDINLTKYVQGSAEGKSVALNIKNVANNVNLNKTDKITETINLADTAIKDKAVKITGLATGDKVQGGALDNTITSPFVQFAKAASGATTLNDKAAYYIDTNADVSTAAKALAALGKVTLASGKALVAFNTDKGTYIYSVSGGTTIAADNFTLAAIVDDKINNKDSIASGAITFTVDNTPKELKAVDVAFAELSGGKLDLADLTAYSDANAITVTGVSGALSVSGANAQIDKVDAFITTASGAVTKESGVTSTVDVYLGGSKTAAGTETLDFSGKSAVASSADKVYLNTTGLLTIKDTTNFGTKLDLSKVDAKINISGAVTTDSGVSGDLTKLFAGADSGDKIALTISGGSSGTFTLTDAQETVTASSSISGDTINLGAGDDKIIINSVAANGLKGATIDGGAGRDTLVVSGDISGSGDFTLKNVEVLEASGATVSYAQIKDQALTLTSTSGTGTLTIKAADTDTAIDLTKLNNKVVSGDATALTALDLTNVGSGDATTVKLDAKDGIAEKITLASNATGVKVSGIAKTNTVAEQDKVSLDDITGLSSVSGGGSSNVFATVNDGTSSSSKTISENKAYYFDYSGSDDLTNTTKVAAILASAYIEGASSSGTNAVLAINKGTDSYIYKITTADASKTIASTELSLIAIVDNKVDGSDTMAAGVITFA